MGSRSLRAGSAAGWILITIIMIITTMITIMTITIMITAIITDGLLLG